MIGRPKMNIALCEEPTSMGRPQDVFEELMIEQGLNPPVKDNKEQGKVTKKESKEKAKAAKLRAKEEAKAAKLKEKEDAKAAKLKEKEDAKAAKLKEKEDAKAAKLKEKEDAKAAAKLKGKNKHVTLNNNNDPFLERRDVLDMDQGELKREEYIETNYSNMQELTA